jgi:hypothetical protein
VAWQDRDVAKLSDGELADLHGVAPSSSRAQSTRVRVWCVLAVVALASGGFAYAKRPALEPVVAPQPQPVVLFGLRGTNTRVDARTPGGVGTVCTDTIFNAAASRWSCVSWSVNDRDLRVIEPAPYHGPCTHLSADPIQARWLCLGSDPVPPRQVPPPAPAALST